MKWKHAAANAPESITMNEAMATRQVEGPDELCVATSELLQQLATAVAQLDSHKFTEKNGPEFMGATIGGHVRHCVDHVKALLTHCNDQIDYDARERGTPVEKDPVFAADALRSASEQLLMLSRAAMPALIQVRVEFCGDGSFTRVASSFRRECAYVLSHTVHHLAMIRGMLHVHGVVVPAEFGFAPATLKALSVGNSKSCAH